MAKKSTREFSESVKRSAVRRIINGERNVDVAKVIGCSVWSLTQWTKRYTKELLAEVNDRADDGAVEEAQSGPPANPLAGRVGSAQAKANATKARKKAEAEAATESSGSPPDGPKRPERPYAAPAEQLDLQPRTVTSNFNHIQVKTDALIAEMTADRDALTEAIELLSAASSKMATR